MKEKQADRKVGRNEVTKESISRTFMAKMLLSVKDPINFIYLLLTAIKETTRIYT